jgi:hypothetical protein
MKVKRITTILLALLIVLCSFSFAFASGENPLDNGETTVATSDSKASKEEQKFSNATTTTKNNLKSKDEKLRIYMAPISEGGRGLSSINAHVLYYLELAQLYSYPVCFIGIVIGSLNFFIIGNKKLDKREQGFNMLVTLILGLIVFQVLPLLFAIIVAGR